MSTKQSIPTNINALLVANTIASGKVMLRKYGNHLVFEPVPERKPTRPTKGQKATQQRFRKAAVYAGKMIKDPEKLAEVPKKMRNRPFAYFVGEYMKQNTGSK